MATRVELEDEDQLRKLLLLEEPKDGNEGAAVAAGVTVRERPEEGEEDDHVGLRGKVWKESKKLWVVAGPGIFTGFSMFGVVVISQAFIGHIGATELAAYALVTNVPLSFANGILLGMARALETFCGQAFGAGQHHMMGIYLQRSWIVLLMISTFFLVPVLIFTTPILRLLGQDPDIAAVSGSISYWFIPVIFSFIFSFTLQMYLQAQSKNIVIAYFAAFSLFVQAPLSWLLSMKLQLGLTGVMISMVLAYCIPVWGQMLFVFCGGCPNTWKGFSMGAFSDLWPLVKLSLSSCAMLCLGLWYDTVLVLLTGNMKNAGIAIDALSICLNINVWEMMIPLGFLAAASVRVSNELGRGSARAAKFSVCVIVATSLSIGIVVFVLFLLFRGSIAYAFTEDPKVAKAVDYLSPLLAFTILLNSLQPVLSGVAVGAGWQSVVAYVNISCYYLIGIPLGASLGFLIGFEVKGIWIGMIFGTLVQTLVLCYITWRTDWEKQVTTAKKRVNRWLLPADVPNGTSTAA